MSITTYHGSTATQFQTVGREYLSARSAKSAASLRRASWVDAISAIDGSDSVHTSNVKDHAQSDQHTHAMLLLKKEQRKGAGLGVACG